MYIACLKAVWPYCENKISSMSLKSLNLSHIIAPRSLECEDWFEEFMASESFVSVTLEFFFCLQLEDNNRTKDLNQKIHNH